MRVLGCFTCLCLREFIVPTSLVSFLNSKVKELTVICLVGQGHIELLTENGAVFIMAQITFNFKLRRYPADLGS